MKITPILVAPVALVALASCLPAQNIFHGNGVPSAYITNSPAVVDQSLRFELGSSTAPNGLGVLSLSGGIGPTVAPFIGLVGLDVFNPFYVTQLFFLDNLGDAVLALPLPPGIGTATSPPFYANSLTVEAMLPFSISKTVRIEWANADGWEQVGSLPAPRQLHTATALGRDSRDNVTQVLIAGGATGSIMIPAPLITAELYDPLLRTVSVMPSMSLPRAGHQAVRLDDGRVLITGGVTTGGLVTASCEFFDQSTQNFETGSPMSVPRAGHGLTLLDDGRVLATGGVADWQNAATLFIAALNTAQLSAEIFDPVTNTWSSLPAMADRRFGHSATRLLDGRVLLVSGINGGIPGLFPSAGAQVPSYTATCELFDPLTNTFAPTQSLGAAGNLVRARGFHGASLLPNGDVLMTGGFIAGIQNGEAIADTSCATWNGVGWTATLSLPAATGMHTQVPLGAGALVTGGFTGDLTLLQTTSMNALHDGATVTLLASIGTDSGGTAVPRGSHSCTELYDGTFLLYGGGQWPLTLGDGWVYTPTPQ